jgi:hypothetical protein
MKEAQTNRYFKFTAWTREREVLAFFFSFQFNCCVSGENCYYQKRVLNPEAKNSPPIGE